MTAYITEEVLYEIDRHVATITLNRPDEMNAFSPEMLRS
jgi:enoyl-CoA hydratase/carnithine racemase